MSRRLIGLVILVVAVALAWELTGRVVSVRVGPVVVTVRPRAR